MLLREYRVYREITGQDCWHLTPRELGLRFEAQKDIRGWQREDLWRATSAAVARVFGDADAEKILM